MLIVMLTNHASGNSPKGRMNKGFAGLLRQFQAVANSQRTSPALLNILASVD